MEYRLLLHNVTGEVCAVREDGMATAPLHNDQFRDDDSPDATIRVDWASDQQYTHHQPHLWDSTNHTLLATDKDPLSAVVDQPQSLAPEDGGDDRPPGA